MGSLEGRVVVITGAGRGLGREHALLMASEGAQVVVNDLGASSSGEGADRTAADEVVEEIRAAGGVAVANSDDVADMEGAEALIKTALEAFGGLHVLVNNAGILRDRLFVNMTEEEWDAVIRVHLRGHFCPTRQAAGFWRERSKAGDTVSACVINTASPSGLTLLNPGQTNYGAAKAGIASLTLVLAQELSRYGVRVNAIAPGARTRLTLQTPGIDAMMAAPEDPDAFDEWHPGHVSPLIAYLASANCPISGRVFGVHGGTIEVLEGWTIQDTLSKERRWTIDELAAELKHLA